MNLVFLISIILKGLGAALEILLQICITASLGIDGYGAYSAWVSGADLIFWVCFSGLVKCNTFYLSGQNTTIRSFKWKYYAYYVLPVLGLGAVGLLLFADTPFAVLIPVITALELLVMDQSSTLITRGRPGISLISEYVLGRLMLLAGVLMLSRTEVLSLNALVLLYAMQYLLVLAFFLLRTKKSGTREDVSGTVSHKKWCAYQSSDLMHAMIEQMPVVLQFFFSGAFEAGVVSVVLLVKKLINFISGPTAKIFLPEFARLYHLGNREKIRDCYATIMRIQMLVVGPLTVVLLGYPRVILGILAKELVPYDRLFMGCSAVFLLVATLGPCGGILQMTGNERADNCIRLTTLVLMAIVMAITRRDSYFVLYGLCTQVAAEAFLKFAYLCRWMKRAPARMMEYMKWWLMPAIATVIAYISGSNDSFLAMLLFAGAVFLIGVWRELKQTAFSRILRRVRSKKHGT